MRITLFIFSFLTAVSVYAQTNLKVGYTYFRPNLTELNRAFKTYNENNKELIEGFGKTSAISYLDLGVRLKVADALGFEFGGKFGQSGINKATYASSTEKWSMRASELNGGLAVYFGDISVGGTLHRSNVAITRNEPTTRKYPSLDESSYWAGSVHVQFEAASGKSSISIRPYYQWAFSNLSFPNTAARLGYKGSSEGTPPGGFGLSVLIYNGKR